jgi:hypothetical protein
MFPQHSTTSPSTNLYRFPERRAAVVWLVRDGPSWLVLAGGAGWTHGSSAAALTDAEWLAANLGGLPIREPKG